MPETTASRVGARPHPARRRTVGVLLLLALTSACASDPGRGALVFFSDRSGDGDIYGAPFVGSPLVPVARTAAKEGGPRYHRHRRRIVHQQFDDADVRLMADTEQLVTVKCEAAPVWAPESDRYAYYQTVGGREDLYLGDLSKGDTDIPLTSDAAADRYPTWSPDGTAIAFAREGESGWDLYRMKPLPGQPAERLTTLTKYCGHPAYSPDGRRIAFETMVGGQTDIAVLEIASGRVDIVVARPGNDIAPTWSLDGRWIAFGGVHPATDNWDVWEIELESATLHRVTTSPAFDGAPVYVPATALPDRRSAAARAAGLLD